MTRKTHISERREWHEQKHTEIDHSLTVKGNEDKDNTKGHSSPVSNHMVTQANEYLRLMT